MDDGGLKRWEGCVLLLEGLALHEDLGGMVG